MTSRARKGLLVLRVLLAGIGVVGVLLGPGAGLATRMPVRPPSPWSFPATRGLTASRSDVAGTGAVAQDDDPEGDDGGDGTTKTTPEHAGRLTGSRSSLDAGGGSRRASPGGARHGARDRAGGGA